jgi:hypothetical protein
MKKEINVAKQPWLGFSRIIQITVDGIRYRLFRASVTVAVIAVAVAFLMNILSESLIKRSVAQSTRDRIRRMRLIHDWSARLTAPGNPESFLKEFAHSTPDGAIYREVSGMTGFDDATMQTFHNESRQAAAYLDFFNSLDYAKRRSLIHTAVSIGIFKRLQTENGMEQFSKGIGQIHSVRFVSTIDELKAFLADWDSLRERIQTVLDARKKAVATVKAALKGRTIDQALANADKGFGDTVRAAGFVFDAETVSPIVASQAQAELDTQRLQDSMDSNACKQLIAQKANVLPADVNVVMMWRYLGSPRFAERYLQRMQEENAKAIAYEEKNKTAPPATGDAKEGEAATSTADQDKGTRLDVEGLTPDRLVTLARARVEAASLIRAERLTVGAGGGFMGLGERLAWLLFVSLLVCGIGIANAMLMPWCPRRLHHDHVRARKLLPRPGRRRDRGHSRRPDRPLPHACRLRPQLCGSHSRRRHPRRDLRLRRHGNAACRLCRGPAFLQGGTAGPDGSNAHRIAILNSELAVDHG